LTIDTVGPTVTAVTLAPKLGEIDVTFADSLAGMDQASVIAGANYLLTRLHARRPAFRVSFLAATSGAPPGPDTVVFAINPRRPLQAGVDTFTILSGTGPIGIRDVAGNALDGEFSGPFPSGNAIPGGNFVAELDAVHHVVLAPQIVLGGATPAGPREVRRAVATRPGHKLAASDHLLPRRPALHDQALTRLAAEVVPFFRERIRVHSWRTSSNSC